MASMGNENNGDKNKRPFEDLHRIPTIGNTTAYIRSLENPLKTDMFKQFTPTELTCILFTLFDSENVTIPNNGPKGIVDLIFDGDLNVVRGRFEKIKQIYNFKKASLSNDSSGNVLSGSSGERRIVRRKVNEKQLKSTVDLTVDEQLIDVLVNFKGVITKSTTGTLRIYEKDKHKCGNITISDLH